MLDAEISKAVNPGVGVQKDGSNHVPIFSFEDVKIITNNFENKINAAGGFGTLFCGTLSDGQEVVVKLLQSNIKQTPIEFLKKAGHSIFRGFLAASMECTCLALHYLERVCVLIRKKVAILHANVLNDTRMFSLFL